MVGTGAGDLGVLSTLNEGSMGSENRTSINYHQLRLEVLTLMLK